VSPPAYGQQSGSSDSGANRRISGTTGKEERWRWVWDAIACDGLDGFETEADLHALTSRKHFHSTYMYVGAKDRHTKTISKATQDVP